VSRLSLRLRLSLAFALAMAVVLVVTGTAVYFGVAETLDEQAATSPEVAEERDETLGSLLGLLLVGGPLALGAATFAGWLLAGAALRPVEAMRRRAAEISADTTGERLPVPASEDEIHRLGTTLNEMLDRLREGETSVHDLTEALGSSQQNVSKHLGVLARAGVVARRKDGNLALYRIADESVFALCEQVCGSLQRQFAELADVVAGGAR
jgi:DNA-binding transcriptional ArsR family regulator